MDSETPPYVFRRVAKAAGLSGDTENLEAVGRMIMARIAAMTADELDEWLECEPFELGRIIGDSE